jgi:hypothetical protein
MREVMPAPAEEIAPNDVPPEAAPVAASGALPQVRPERSEIAVAELWEQVARDAVQVDPNWHKLLEKCDRASAEKATVVRKGLRSLLGRHKADALLSNYRQAPLRIPGAGCQRLYVDSSGATVRLAANAAATPQ